eukprot:GFUD01034639.1.p1 GENE.GFUD01034639.1~~GFUD01034639.1.p1  ORF type:complete len:353 (-),score=65.76 GFUD01034639.1:88-1146(-)
MSQTPFTHITTLLNYAKENIASSYNMTLKTSGSSFPAHLCLVMSQCPLLATIIQSVPSTMQDSPTILMPQFSSTSVKSLMSLLYSGQCFISQDCKVEELKQIIAAVGFNVGADDLKVVKVDRVLSDMDATEPNNNIPELTCEIKIELKCEPEDVIKIESTNISGKRSRTVQFKCSDCKKIFSCKKSLVRHTNEVHAGGRLFFCSECFRFFGRDTHSRGHEGHHVNPKNLSGLVKTKKLSEDIARVFSKEAKRCKGKEETIDVETLSCQYCDKHFKTKSKVGRHVVEVHYGGNLYFCQECFKVNKSKESFSGHCKAKNHQFRGQGVRRSKNLLNALLKVLVKEEKKQLQQSTK